MIQETGNLDVFESDPDIFRIQDFNAQELLVSSIVCELKSNDISKAMSLWRKIIALSKSYLQDKNDIANSPERYVLDSLMKIFEKQKNLKGMVEFLSEIKKENKDIFIYCIDEIAYGVLVNYFKTNCEVDLAKYLQSSRLFRNPGMNSNSSSTSSSSNSRNSKGFDLQKLNDVNKIELKHEMNSNNVFGLARSIGFLITGGENLVYYLFSKKLLKEGDPFIDQYFRNAGETEDIRNNLSQHKEDIVAAGDGQLASSEIPTKHLNKLSDSKDENNNIDSLNSKLIDRDDIDQGPTSSGSDRLSLASSKSQQYSQFQEAADVFLDRITSKEFLLSKITKLQSKVAKTESTNTENQSDFHSFLLDILQEKRRKLDENAQNLILGNNANASNEINNQTGIAKEKGEILLMNLSGLLPNDSLSISNSSSSSKLSCMQYLDSLVQSKAIMECSSEYPVLIAQYIKTQLQVLVQQETSKNLPLLQLQFTDIMKNNFEIAIDSFVEQQELYNAVGPFIAQIQHTFHQTQILIAVMAQIIILQETNLPAKLIIFSSLNRLFQSEKNQNGIEFDGSQSSAKLIKSLKTYLTILLVFPQLNTADTSANLPIQSMVPKSLSSISYVCEKQLKFMIDDLKPSSSVADIIKLNSAVRSLSNSESMLQNLSLKAAETLSPNTLVILIGLKASYLNLDEIDIIDNEVNNAIIGLYKTQLAKELQQSAQQLKGQSQLQQQKQLSQPPSPQQNQQSVELLLTHQADFDGQILISFLLQYAGIAMLRKLPIYKQLFEALVVLIEKTNKQKKKQLRKSTQLRDQEQPQDIDQGELNQNYQVVKSSKKNKEIIDTAVQRALSDEDKEEKDENNSLNDPSNSLGPSTSQDNNLREFSQVLTEDDLNAFIVTAKSNYSLCVSKSLDDLIVSSIVELCREKKYYDGAKLNYKYQCYIEEEQSIPVLLAKLKQDAQEYLQLGEKLSQNTMQELHHVIPDINKIN